MNHLQKLNLSDILFLVGYFKIGKKMYKVSREQFTHFWDFLKTLDCYIKSESGMIEELEEFANNPNREIAALVCQNTSGRAGRHTCRRPNGSRPTSRPRR